MADRHVDKAPQPNSPFSYGGEKHIQYLRKTSKETL